MMAENERCDKRKTIGNNKECIMAIEYLNERVRRTNKESYISIPERRSSHDYPQGCYKVGDKGYYNVAWGEINENAAPICKKGLKIIFISFSLLNVLSVLLGKILSILNYRSFFR